MPDIDKLQTVLQWAGGISLIVAAAIAAVWKIMRDAGNEPDRVRDERERAERSKRYSVERELEVERLERRFEKIIEALRVSILGEIKAQQDAWREDFKIINGRVTAVERDVDAHARRPRQ